MSYKNVINLFCAISLPCRIALRCLDVLSSTGFSLCGLNCGASTVHRLKPVLLDRADNSRLVRVKNADQCMELLRYFAGFFVALLMRPRKLTLSSQTCSIIFQSVLN
jgi:hypothetical protein